MVEQPSPSFCFRSSKLKRRRDTPYFPPGFCARWPCYSPPPVPSACRAAEPCLLPPPRVLAAWRSHRARSSPLCSAGLRGRLHAAGSPRGRPCVSPVPSVPSFSAWYSLGTQIARHCASDLKLWMQKGASAPGLGSWGEALETGTVQRGAAGRSSGCEFPHFFTHLCG